MHSPECIYGNPADTEQDQMKDKRILEAWREPDGLCVVTAYGYAFEPDSDHNSAGHFHIFDSQKEAKRRLAQGGPCACLRCTSQGKDA